ncbi:hypothetical protein L873DRAFT_919213 [Choiromyces venosus 120613-1]|uniref:Uncharacterized protein n=1 Tax=Choiromyces venosus 120613-1 TaxID=1336337 RepID=A0A3N4JM63_9PEZI|nr:hypothetical protein L873DRAFT_919213 [Choiromyces venosus 120613-1]
MPGWTVEKWGIFDLSYRTVLPAGYSPDQTPRFHTKFSHKLWKKKKRKRKKTTLSIVSDRFHVFYQRQL